MITFSFTLKQIYKNSFKFVFINLKNNLICFIVQVLVLAVYGGILAIFLEYIFFVLTIECFVFMLTYPTFKFLLVQFCVFPVIKKYIIDPYYEEHPNEDLDKRRDLGLYTEEKDEQEDIFND